jgi:high affinity sulfate transporter 1
MPSASVDNSENSPLLSSQPDPSFERDPMSEQNNWSKKFMVRLRYYIPVVGWLSKYKLSDLQSDTIAGLTVASLIIPQGLSYAQALVDIPPVLGLVSAFIPQFVYAILGTSRQFAVGPEALVSILVGSSVREFMLWRDANPMSAFDDGIDPYRNIQATALLCLLIGLFTFLLGIFRLGFLDSILSRALLRGFVLAVAFVVVIDMSETMFGFVKPVGQCQDRVHQVYGRQAEMDPGQGEPASPFQLLLSVLMNLSNAHILTTALSFASILFLFMVRKLKSVYHESPWIPMIPEILILVVVTTSLTQFFRWDCAGLAILNDIKTTMPDNVKTYPLPTLAKIKHLTLSAVLITLIGFVESIAVAKTYASKYDYPVSPNRDLVALGTANIISSFFGAFPAFGSLGRSAVNDAAGAKTQLSGFITGSIVLMTYLWLLPLFKYLPKAVCSSIIVVAASRLFEFEEIYFLTKIRAWSDIFLLLMTFSSTLFISIETGTLLSVGASLLMVVKHTTRVKMINFRLELFC